MQVRRYSTDHSTPDLQIFTLFEQAIQDLKINGATIIEPFVELDFEEFPGGIWCEMFRHGVIRNLASPKKNAARKNLREIVASGLYSPYIEKRLHLAQAVDTTSVSQDVYTEPRNIPLRQAILAETGNHHLNAILYPTWSNCPWKIGNLEPSSGGTSQHIPPHTAMSAITVPMGFFYSHLPAGLQIVARFFNEPTLIGLAYGDKQVKKTSPGAGEFFRTANATKPIFRREP